MRIGEEEGRLVGEEDGGRIGDVEVLVGDLEGLPPDLRSPLGRRRIKKSGRNLVHLWDAQLAAVLTGGSQN